MKISHLIIMLQDVINSTGDIEVYADDCENAANGAVVSHAFPLGGILIVEMDNGPVAIIAPGKRALQIAHMVAGEKDKATRLMQAAIERAAKR